MYGYGSATPTSLPSIETSTSRYGDPSGHEYPVSAGADVSQNSSQPPPEPVTYTSPSRRVVLHGKVAVPMRSESSRVGSAAEVRRLQSWRPGCGDRPGRSRA